MDEIGELPAQMQTKLLHVIEDKEVRPIGGEQTRRRSHENGLPQKPTMKTMTTIVAAAVVAHALMSYGRCADHPNRGQRMSLNVMERW